MRDTTAARRAWQQNATVRTDHRGTRIYKEAKHSTRRIDAAVAAVMAYATAANVEPRVQMFVFDS
jgi:phage terminase large subunit-like protein